MKMFLLVFGLILSSSAPANALVDTLVTPDLIQLAKITKTGSKSKYWVLYHAPSDLLTLEKEGYTILKTKVKLIRNNQFWLDMWQSSIQMAAGFMIAKADGKNSKVMIPSAMAKPSENVQILKFY